MPELPTGTVTFLFTDLEGSTRLWEEHPEAMKIALARHDEILRGTVESHGGYVVKTTGDGVHAAFSDPAAAVNASVAIQRALADNPPEPALAVRMGIHTGAAELRTGDYFGTAVNRAARLMSAAHGGQIVMSLATEELVHDALTADVGVIDLGDHRLRDLSRAERIFQIFDPQQPTEFPQLETLDSRPGNLPTQLTSFVGREDELAQVATALENARLVTITGVGGVGKTRLAIQVAAEVLPAYPDGVWLFELAAANDPETMAQVVAAGLGAKPRSGMTLPESIADFLRTKRILLVVDNCEHLTASIGRLVDLVLHHCQDVRVLATSREGLAVAGEQMWALRSLPVPPAAAPAEEVARNDAVLLFTERARAVRAAFTIDASNADAVRDICARLDGIPLALELAAARAGSMSPSEIASFLDERFRLLTGGRRTAVDRHQTLRATVDWSYSLLDERSRFVFDRLGVFAGSFDAAAASAIVADDDIERWDVLDALDDLVAKSMVVAEETTHGTTRYQLLETLRAYALERLDEPGEADTYRRRHAAHFATVVEELGPTLVGPEELACRARFMLELDNLRAAVTWALSARQERDEEIVLRVVNALTLYSLADPSLLADWPDRALAELPTASVDAWRSVFAAAAQVAAARGDTDATRALALSGLQGRGREDHSAAAVACGALSYASAMTGDYSTARRSTTEGVSAAQAVGDRFGEIVLHAYAAYWASQFGDPLHARASADAALALARELGNPSALVSALGAVGYVLTGDDDERALAALMESVEIGRAGVAGRTFGISLAVAARLRARRGDDAAEVFAGLLEAIAREAQSGERSILVFELNCAVEALKDADVPELAAILAGIVDGGRLAGASIAAGSTEELEQGAIRAELQATLGTVAYSARHARGAGMPYDEAIAFAIDELDQLVVANRGADA